MPVTSKAQSSGAYQEYLARSGEDNDEHYDVKIRASKLLLDNTHSTFVTPVYNGSASLRSAAGQMIEEVTKAVRRKKTVDDAFMEKLFADMTSLYRLDQLAGQGKAEVIGEGDPGPLPDAAVALIAALAGTWILMGAYVLRQRIRKKK